MQFLKKLYLSKPKSLFISFRSCFQIQLLISFSYYHLYSFSVFSNEVFLIRSEENKQHLLSVYMKEGHGYQICHTVFFVNQESRNPGLIWQDFLCPVGQQNPVQNTPGSLPSLEPETNTIMLLRQSKGKIQSNVQVAHQVQACYQQLTSKLLAQVKRISVFKKQK